MDAFNRWQRSKGYAPTRQTPEGDEEILSDEHEHEWGMAADRLAYFCLVPGCDATKMREIGPLP